MPTINQMKRELKNKYSGKDWNSRVDKMPDAQVIAIWYKVLERSKKKREENKKKEAQRVIQPSLFDNMDSPNPFRINYDIFECGEGWHELINDALQRIRTIIIRDNLNIEIDQIKTKFGGLRLYLSAVTPEIETIIDEAEKKSKTICEICGDPGFFGGNMDGWYMTRCIKCRPPGTIFLEED